MLRRRTLAIAGTNSIASLERVRLGGVEQWLLIRGKERNNPLLLFLHGGPGMAQIAWARRYQARLEERFVVVNWDQRGAGLSYSERVPASSMTVGQFVSDTLELTRMLLRRFGQEKTYLVGHSWGSVPGTLAVGLRPELFHAYVGVGQLVDAEEGEKISYRFVLETAKKNGNSKAVRDLERIGPPPYRDGFEAVRIQRKWLAAFGGTVYGGDFFAFMLGHPLKGLALSTEYTLRDGLRWGKGLSFSGRAMWNELMRVNLMEQARELRVPVYFCTGRHDRTAPFELAERYYQRLVAPEKTWIWFEDCGHLVPYEAPDRFQDVLVERVLGETSERSP